MRVVLDDRDAVPGGDLADRVHLAPDPGVVHHYDRTGARRDQAFEQTLVEVEGVGADIGEDQAGHLEGQTR